MPPVRDPPALDVELRPAKNCAECRRLKIKCDRKIPCSSCTRRGCADLCPGEAYPARKLMSERRQLLERVRQLEAERSIILSYADGPTASTSVSGPSAQHTGDETGVRGPAPSSASLARDAPALSDNAMLLSPRQGYTFSTPSLQNILSLPEDVQSSPRREVKFHQPLSPESVYEASERRRVRANSPQSLPLNSGDSPQEAASGDPVRVSGTLVVSGGQSRYMGASAIPLWLSEDTQDRSETRPSSPTRQSFADPSTSSFFAPANLRGYRDALEELPAKEEGWMLVECDYRYLAWGGASVSKEQFKILWDQVYEQRETGTQPSGFSDTCLAFQRLAMVFSVLALGTLMSLELSFEDPTGKHYFEIARQCLVNGRFLTATTLIGVQTTSALARFCSYAGMRSGWDMAWQLRGLAMRLVLAMGLHRDGKSWGLPADELDNRRRTFWEAFNNDVFLSRCWDRPTSLAAGQYDTGFPDDYYPPTGTGYELQRCKLAELVKTALDESLNIRPSPYGHVEEIWQSIVKGEAEIPYILRCRATTRAMVSRYATQEQADDATPEPSRRDVRLAFQQHALTLDYCAAVFLLLRPYFVHSLYTFPDDPTKSPYASAYLAVIERSSMMIAMLRSIHSLFPILSPRHWQFWSHAFSGAVCMATVCVVSPASPLVPLALTELESVISLLQSILSSLPRPELRKNLNWLLRIYERAKTKVAASHAAPGEQAPSESPKDADEHLSFVGWRTRLIRLGEARPPALRPLSRSAAADLGVPSVDSTSGHSWELDLVPNMELGQLGQFPWDALPPLDSGEGVPVTSPDFLQQLLGAPLGQPFPMNWGAPDDEAGFGLQNF